MGRLGCGGGYPLSLFDLGTPLSDPGSDLVGAEGGLEGPLGVVGRAGPAPPPPPGRSRCFALLLVALGFSLRWEPKVTEVGPKRVLKDP